MKLENVVPWGRTLEEYQKMFQLSEEALHSKILGCGDGPSSFNSEGTKRHGNITSIDPIYQFTTDEIQQRINKTSTVVSKQLRQNKDDFVWNTISSVDELINMRLTAMSDFIDDYEKGKKEQRYLHQELPKLTFEDNSFELVLSSHFLFLYSAHFDLQFHVDAILEMCRVSKDEVRIFPLLDLNNQKSPYLEPIMKHLKNRGFESKIIKTDYEFQKGANELLSIKVLRHS